jgi:hypothetical protein
MCWSGHDYEFDKGIFTCPQDGCYEINGGMIDMKAGDRVVTNKEWIDPFLIKGGYNGKLRSTNSQVLQKPLEDA